MKLLLINPKTIYSSHHAALNDFLVRRIAPCAEKHPALVLLILAALTPKHWEVGYIEENTRPIDFESDADLVAIGCMTSQATRAYEIADRFRSHGARVVLGGIHPTFLPEEAQKHSDAVVVGEAEGVWQTLLADARRGQLKPRYDGQLFDLTKSPVPRYDLIQMEDFADPPYTFAPVQFSRGCPRGCSFCSVTLIYGRKHRVKNQTQITKEIEAAISACSSADVIIKLNDANPFIHHAQAMTMLRAIESMKVRWVCSADIDISSDPKLLDAMANAGCVTVSIGFESIDPKALKDVSSWKKSRIASYAESVRIIHDHGILVAGNIILGLKAHTKEDLKRIRDFSVDNRLAMQFTIATPYPGTSLYKSLQREGRLFPNIPWHDYTGYNVVYEMGMDPDEVLADCCWLHEQTMADDYFDELKQFGNVLATRRPMILI